MRVEHGALDEGGRALRTEDPDGVYLTGRSGPAHSSNGRRRRGVEPGSGPQDLQALAINGQTLIGMSVDNSSDVVTPAGVWLGNLTRFGQD